jgi:predicted nucleic acid-binding Zn ribbon protein
MPIREYQVKQGFAGCSFCKEPFERLEKAGECGIEKCPACGAPLERMISAPQIGASRSGLDYRAKNAGFHKLKKLGKGEYEKVY